MSRETRQPRGFTLLELLIVSVLMMLVTMGTAGLWRHYSAQMANIRQRAETSQELRLALEYLRRDLGPLVWASPVTEDRLVVCRLDSAGNQAMIEYFLENGKLVRHEQAGGLALPVAGEITGFLAENVSDTILRVVVTAGAGASERQAVLLWSRT